MRPSAALAVGKYSKTRCATGSRRDWGITLPGNARPVSGSIKFGRYCWLIADKGSAEKSPLRCAAVGTTEVRDEGRERTCVPCQEPKKKVRFLTIGPPNAKPY